MKSENKDMSNWIAGFVDGEASFCVGLIKRKDTRIGITPRPVFQIDLHIRDKEVLELIKEFFGIGGVYTYKCNGINHVKYQVTHRSEIANVIIPFFNKYKLKTRKAGSFERWKEVFFLVCDNVHLTKEGIGRVVKLSKLVNKHER